MGEIRKFLGELVVVWRDHVAVAREQAKAAREQALATVVLAENMAALRDAAEEHFEYIRRITGAAMNEDEERVQ
jgi:hypothetical protein